MYVRVNAYPESRKERFVAVKGKDHTFDAFVKEPAERNMANVRIRLLLAENYNVPLGKVRMITGHHSPTKIFTIDN